MGAPKQRLSVPTPGSTGKSGRFASSSTAWGTPIASEVWDGSQLVGGLYGVALAGAFFGESMFSRARDASKIALVHLVGRGSAIAASRCWIRNSRRST